ncbi:thermonuclease family protein [Patescibacteria group bacterium AH-259-L07]|nr:thermonuclease family protein [Patescibacteria group bacterium AH-259-L07]
MKKQHLATIMQLLLAAITFVVVLAGGFALLGKKELAKEILSIFLAPLIALFAGTTVLYIAQDSADTAPESVEVEQEIENMIPNLYGPDDKLYFVFNVIDGDTIKVNGTMRVRLIGIDAPEAGECYYEDSKNALASLISGEYVRLEKDVDAVDDRGRLLRYVFLPSQDLMENDIFVNAYLLRRGFAKTSSQSPNNRHDKYFISVREEALMQRQGLWDVCEDSMSGYEQEAEKRREAHEPPTDPNCTIKGNISTVGVGKTYSFPGCPTYAQTKIDTRKGEQYFCTEEEAQAAGFIKTGNCP